MSEVRNFKNNVFTTLFDDPDLLRELYCALAGVSLPLDVPVSINTLQNVLFMDFNNDISFEIGGKLVVLVEHQSTINPNIALRFLHYISDVLKGIVESKTIYSTKQISIPWPEFYVLYNGKDEFPDSVTYRLSDLFIDPQSLNLPKKDHPLLELEVKVLNINDGKNAEVVSRCKKLAEYSLFIAKARYFSELYNDREKGIAEAIKYCSSHDILKEFLEVHGRRILNMILTEWNWDDAKEVWQEEAREEALEKGLEKVARNALAEGYSIESVQRITGLSYEDIEKLQSEGIG